MQPQALTPLPFDNSKNSRSYQPLGNEDFVDEELVSGLIERGCYERYSAEAEIIGLPSSEDDYAGWSLPVRSPFRGMREVLEIPSGDMRRATPPIPAYSADGVETAYTGGHRWWLFGVSGAIACGLLTLTLLSLAQRRDIHEASAEYAPVLIEPQEPAIIAAEPVLQPTLTNVPRYFH